MLIVRNKAVLLNHARQLNEEWRGAENQQGEVILLRQYIIVDLLDLIGLTDRSSFEAVFGEPEGRQLWQEESRR